MDYECLKILSLNVRGMKDAKKRREIFRWLKRYHGAESSVIFLQETHSEMETEKYWDKDWGSKIYFSHGTNYARGVAIMMPMKFNFEIGNFWADKDGRIVTICLKYNDEYLTLVFYCLSHPNIKYTGFLIVYIHMQRTLSTVFHNKRQMMNFLR